MDKLQAMRTFVRVVEAGSFSAVAHESDTTQGAVSKQVAALERELGAKLLTRTTRIAVVEMVSSAGVGDEFTNRRARDTPPLRGMLS